MGLPWLTLIKWAAVYLGPIAVAIGIYLKGLSAGKDSKQAEIDSAQRDAEDKARAAEIKNQSIEKERYDQVEKVRDAANNPDELVKLFNEGPWGSKNSDSPSKPKAD